MRSTDTLAALLIGALIGIGLTMALQIEVPGADAGDWLAFTGALVGVVVTILGTLWLEHHRVTSGERQNRRIVADAVRGISAALGPACRARGDEPTAQARSDRIAAEEAMLKAFDKLMYARHYVPKRDIDCWHAVERLWSAVEYDRREVAIEKDNLVAIGDSEDALAANIEFMGRVAERLKPHLASVRRELLDG